MGRYKGVFAENLIAQRRFAGLTQGQLASMTGIPRRTISRYESGENRDPSYDSLNKLATYFGVEPRALVEQAGLPPGPDLRVILAYREFLDPTELRILNEFAREARTRSLASAMKAKDS